MSVVVWIVLGLLGGSLAGWLTGRRRGGLASYAVVGVLGAMLGGFMASVMLGLDIADINGTSVMVAAVGAAILILILRVLPPAEVFD